ncbi:YibE/F family protein [Streptomyces canarius]
MEQYPYQPPEPPRRDGPEQGDGHGHGPRDHGHSHGNSHSHGHSHHHGPAAPVSQHLRKVIAAILVPFTAAVLVGLVVLWPGHAPSHKRTGVGFDRQTQQATVTRVVEVSCKSVNASGGTPAGDTSSAEGTSAEAETDRTCKKATIRVDTGKDEGRTFTEIVQPDQSRQLHQGEKVVVAYEPSAPKDLQYSVTDVNRKFPMALLAGIFAVAVVVVGRLRGVMALVALAVSFLVLTLFILPAILEGANPLLVAVVGSSAIMLIALYMCHGLSARTSVAVLGTLISLCLIGVLGSLFIGWAALTGNTDDNTGLIRGTRGSGDVRGLWLARDGQGHRALDGGRAGARWGGGCVWFRRCGVNRGQGSLPEREGAARARKSTEGGLRRPRGRTPWGVPDFNRPPPPVDGSRGKLPSPEGTGPPSWVTGSRVPHQSLRDEEFPMNLRTM